jgi:hypothetical protein
MKRIFIIIALVSITLIIFSCNYSPIGIFQSLEIESELDDGGLNNDLSVGTMTKKGNTYFIAAGLVYKRNAKEGASWSKISSPKDDYICQDLALFGDTLYAIFFNTDGKEAPLYTLKGGDTFKPVDGFEKKQCTNIITLDEAEQLFVTEKTGDKKFKIHYRKDTETEFKQSAIDIEDLSDDILDFQITDAAYQVDAGKTWLIAGNRLLTTTDSGKTLSAADKSPDTKALFGGIHYSQSLEALFVTTEDGVLYGYREGAGWGGGSKELEGSPRFYDVIDFPLRKDEVVLVVGSEQGYYEKLYSELPVKAEDIKGIKLENPGLQGVTSTFNYLNTKLADCVIQSFFYDDEKLFACTLNQGLWRNEGKPDKRSWNRE